MATNRHRFILSACLKTGEADEESCAMSVGGIRSSELMSDGLDQQRQARDHRGRWQRGTTGNPAGRPRGSRNRWRRADPARAILWKASEWRLHFARTMTAAQGDPDQKAAAAYAECQRLWRLLHPPRTKSGMCPQCGYSLSLPNPSFGAAPIPFDNVFVHYNCLCQFALSRWEEARLALHRLGIISA